MESISWEKQIFLLCTSWYFKLLSIPELYTLHYLLSRYIPKLNYNIVHWNSKIENIRSKIRKYWHYIPSVTAISHSDSLSLRTLLSSTKLVITNIMTFVKKSKIFFRNNLNIDSNILKFRTNYLILCTLKGIYLNHSVTLKNYLITSTTRNWAFN